MDNGASSYRRFRDNGDESGLTEIIRDYKDGLIFYLNSFVGNILIAEELAEDTFFLLGTKKPRDKGKSSFKTWLYTIGRNIAIDFLRKNSKQKEVSIEDCPDVCIKENGLERSYLREERKITVHHAMSKLKPEYRQVLWLVYFESFQQKQVAAVMGEKVHAIETLVYRAKKSLKSQLEIEDFIYEEMSRDVFRRIEEYKENKKKNIRRITRIIVPSALCCAIVLGIVFMMPNYFKQMPPITDPSSTNSMEKEALQPSSHPEKSEASAPISTAPPSSSAEGTNSYEKNDSAQPAKPIEESTPNEQSNSGNPNGESNAAAYDYLITKEVDFHTAKHYFPNLTECIDPQFIKYEVEIAMPADKAVAINYIFGNGTVAIHDNTVAAFMPSDERYEPIALEGKVYYVEKKPGDSDKTTVICFDDTNRFYYVASMKCSDGDIKAIVRVIESLVIR